MHVDVAWIHAPNPQLNVPGHVMPKGQGTALVTVDRWKYYLSAKNIPRTLQYNVLGDDKTASFCMFYFYLCQHVELLSQGLCPYNDNQRAEVHVRFWQREWRRASNRPMTLKLRTFDWEEIGRGLRENPIPK